MLLNQNDTDKKMKKIWLLEDIYSISKFNQADHLLFYET